MNKTSQDNLSKGIFRENPVFVMLLGMCPTLGVTTSAFNGLGMGFATLFVLILSNAAVSLFKKFIPDGVRIPAFIVIIASFVTIIDMLMAAYIPTLHQALGIYIPLIVVNCLILGRAEAFASKNDLLESVLDAVGMGLGFTIALFLLGSMRELLGAGSWLGFSLWSVGESLLLFIMPPGAFLALGALIAGFNKLRGRK